MFFQDKFIFSPAKRTQCDHMIVTLVLFLPFAYYLAAHAHLTSIRKAKKCNIIGTIFLFEIDGRG